jgi:hypothetical protein
MISPFQEKIRRRFGNFLLRRRERQVVNPGHPGKAGAFFMFHEDS